MTDITDTVLVSALIPELRKECEEMQCQIEDGLVAELRKDAPRAIEWRLDNAITLAAKIEVKRRMANEYELMLKNHEGDAPLRTTREGMAKVAWSIGKEKRAVPRSSSLGSNLLEQHILDYAVRLLESTWELGEFRRAQQNDPEVVTEYQRQWELDRAYKAMRDEADAENKKFDRRAARRARKEA